MKKRILSAIMVLTLVLSCGITAFAEYENTFLNTGNNAKDIVGVATTQIGYVEGNNNYTKYGEYYDLPNAAWSALFVTWCAEMAGVKSDVIPTFSNCELGRKWYVNRELYKENGEYIPKTGDIVFYDWNEDGVADHIGIVEGVDGEFLLTIEGNYGDCVAKITDVEYKSDEILGYATPKYENKEVSSSDGKLLKIKKLESDSVRYGDKLMLQSNMAVVPQNTEFKWTIDGDALTITPDAGGRNCYATPVLKGEATITVSLVDKEGNILKDNNGNDISDSVKITSKVNFFWKIISFFKDLFGIDRIVY